MSAIAAYGRRLVTFMGDVRRGRRTVPLTLYGAGRWPYGGDWLTRLAVSHVHAGSIATAEVVPSAYHATEAVVR